MMCIYASSVRTVGVFCVLKLPDAAKKYIPLSLIPTFHMEDPVFNQLKRCVATKNKTITLLCEQYAGKLTEAVWFMN